ncbi:MAG TPA: trigger factor [Anaerolineales bacterium]|nr:trigger factor [Anaerolineales bacterium]
MKIEQQPTDDHQVKLIVEVESEAMENARQRAARKIAKRTRIPGFRPGKAPYHVIARQVGEPAILEEALEILVNEVYPQAIDEAGINPYGPGSLDNVPSMDPPVLEFIIPLEAEVTVGDYQAMRRDYEPPEVTEEQVEDVLQDLRQRQAVIEPVERPAEEGDIVSIRLTGMAEQTEAEIDPELDAELDPTEPLINEENISILVKAEDEADQDEEWPYPGFSRTLLGLSAGDTREFEHTFPEETPYDELAAKKVNFTLNVSDVKKRTLPEVDDEFAKSFGPYDDLAALRADIRESLEQQAAKEYNEEFDNEILAEVVAASEIKYPPQMLEREIDSVISNLSRRLEEQNFTLDLYLKTRAMEMDELRTEVTPTAETRLKNMLCLYEIAEQEKIEIEKEELQSQAQMTMNYLERGLEPREAQRLDRDRLYLNVLNSLAADLLSTRAIERLRSIFKGEAPGEAPGEADAVVESTDGEPVSAEEPVAATEEAPVEVTADAETPETEPAAVEETPAATAESDTAEAETPEAQSEPKA